MTFGTFWRMAAPTFKSTPGDNRPSDTSEVFAVEIHGQSDGGIPASAPAGHTYSLMLMVVDAATGYEIGEVIPPDTSELPYWTNFPDLPDR